MTTCDRCGEMNPADIHTCTPKVRSMIDMAREAGNNDLFDAMQVAFLERFEALVRVDERNRTWTQEHWTEYERSIAAVEREACAKDFEAEADTWTAWPQAGAAKRKGAAAIRARGQA